MHLPLWEGDASHAQLNNATEEESGTQRNITEALALSALDPTPPPTNISDPKVCISTFAEIT